MTDHGDDFHAFCMNASAAQVPAIYWKEKENQRPSMAAIAKAVCIGRGLGDPSHERVEWREDNERF